LHRAGALARLAARAYASFMARSDCPVCHGDGWKLLAPGTAAAGSAPAVETKLVLGHGNGDAHGGADGTAVAREPYRYAVLCDCTATDRTERTLDRARIPKRYRECTFENYDTDTDRHGASPAEIEFWNQTLVQAKLNLQGFARDFPASTDHGLLLMGTCGVGKTHLAVAALQEVVLRGHSGLFYDYRELLKEIQASYSADNPVTEMGVLEPVLTVEVLLLDDLGSSKPSPWALETVGHILNTRYNANRVTLLTTNFLDADTPREQSGIAAIRNPNALEEKLADRVGPRIRSRMYEMCRMVHISGPDYRKEFRRAGPLRS
jgi:DNA replication protein DnaC